MKAKLMEEPESARGVRRSQKLDLLEKSEKKSGREIKDPKTIYKGMSTKEIYVSLKKIKHTNVDFPESEKKRLL